MDVTGWPDPDEVRRWQQALDDVVRRISEERGVQDVARVFVRGDALWVGYGDLQVPVTGEDAEVWNTDELFRKVDNWVAFGRSDGPGRVLARDRHRTATWRARLPHQVRCWTRAADRVFADVVATAGDGWWWRVEVHEDEEVWPDRLPVLDGAYGSTAVFAVLGTGEPPPLPRRPLAFPEVWLHAGDPDLTQSATSLHESDDDAEEDTAHVASVVQDWVVDAVHGAWPACPGHGHPAAPTLDDARTAVWVCPGDEHVVALIGSLGTAGH
jgi:hypothetical protein